MWLWLVVFIVAGFASISVYLYFNQKNMVFYPTQRLDSTPEQVGLSYQDLRLAVNSDESIHAWYFPRPEGSTEPAGRTVLFCHGNGGNMSHRLETVEYLLAMNSSVLLFDYRGYGLSDGEPSEVNCYADAEACYEWLCQHGNIAPEDIVVFGRSLGGAVAVDLASRVPCGGLIVESSFTSALDMGRQMFPIFPIGLLLRYRFDSAAKIGDVSCPILVTHSPHDEVAPFELGQRLFELAPEPKRMVRIGGGHNDRDYFAEPEYREAIRGILLARGTL